MNSASRGSPSLPPVHTLQNGGSPYRDPRSLPPIYANGSATDDPRRSSAYHDGMSPVSNGPPSGSSAYSPNGMRPQDYGNSYGGRPAYPSNGLNFENLDGYVDGKQKKRRGNLPKPVTDILRMWFAEHIAHPYPTEDEKQVLMNRTGLTISQVGWRRRSS